MKEIRLIPDGFDTALFNKVANHPLQSWEWGEARKSTGVKVVRIGEHEHEKLISVFSYTLHPIPYTPYSVGYLPRSVTPSKEVLDFLFSYGKKHNLIFIKLEPYVLKSYPLPPTPLRLRSGQAYTLTPSPHPLFPSWTQILDLAPTEDELLSHMKPKTRYNIRLAQKKGVVVKEESTDEGFETFSKLYFETCKRQHYFGHTPSYHRTIWNHLKGSVAHILTAYFDNTPIASYELFYFQEVLYYTYGGTSQLHRNTMAANLLMWETIRLGKKLGAKKLDMWGSLPPEYDPHHDWAGFTRFKEGYGTTFVETIGSFDLVINPVFYQIYNLAHSLRSVILTLRK